MLSSSWPLLPSSRINPPSSSLFIPSSPPTQLPLTEGMREKRGILRFEAHFRSLCKRMLRAESEACSIRKVPSKNYCWLLCLRFSRRTYAGGSCCCVCMFTSLSIHPSSSSCHFTFFFFYFLKRRRRSSPCLRATFPNQLITTVAAVFLAFCVESAVKERQNDGESQPVTHKRNRKETSIRLAYNHKVEPLPTELLLMLHSFVYMEVKQGTI